MVGFALALAGGAAKGWGAGQLEAIKAKREEKLKMLEYDLQRRGQDITVSEGAANRASQEKLTTAQLEMNKKLAEMQEAGATGRTKLTTEAQKDISTAGNLSSEKIAEANRKMQENLAGLQTEAAKELAQMQIDAQKALNSTLVPMEDGTWKLKIGDEFRGLGNDPITGKPIMPLATDADTPEMKNYKYLISTGVEPPEARSLTFDKSKGGDEVDIFKSIQAARGDFAPEQTEEGKLADAKIAKQIADSFNKGSTDAETTAPEDIQIPASMTDEQVKAWIDEALAASDDPDADRAKIKAAVRRNGRDLKKLGLE